MRDNSIDKRTKLLILAGFAGALLVATVVLGRRNEPMAKSKSASSGGTYVTAPTASTSGATKLEFKTQPKQLKAGEPAIWLPKIFDAKTNEPVRNFETVHEKMMHLIVMSKDLSWFAHLLPEYKDHGLFITRTALPRAGTYKLFAAYTPRDGTPEMVQHEFNVSGRSTPAAKPALVADEIGRTESGWILGQATVRPEGEPNDGNADANLKDGIYQVAMMPKPAKIVAGKPVTLHFSVRDDAAGTYVSDLKPYLGAMGHLTIISGDTHTYLEAEPMDKGSSDIRSKEGAVVFQTNFPTAGLYKVWAEFQHQDYVITAPFVLHVEASSGTSATTKQAAYYCPMHPEVTSNDPNVTCSKCGGMKLVKRS